MGIGRFSLTPILPLMQQDAGLTLTVGGWLATGNYLGYLVGALFCVALTPAPAPAIRWGLPLGRAVHAGDGTFRWAAAVAGLAVPGRRGERLRAGRDIRMGDADPCPSRQGGMVGIRLRRCRHRDRVCGSVRPCGRHRGLWLARDLGRARHCRHRVGRDSLAAVGRGCRADHAGRFASASGAAAPCDHRRSLLRRVRLWLHHSGNIPSGAGARLHR
jgi:hypothetical protein